MVISKRTLFLQPLNSAFACFSAIFLTLPLHSFLKFKETCLLGFNQNWLFKNWMDVTSMFVWFCGNLSFIVPSVVG